MSNIKQELVETKFAIGAVVKHRFLDFRGVIFDVDPEFNNTEEWYQSIPSSIRCLLYTSPSPRDGLLSRMPSSA